MTIKISILTTVTVNDFDTGEPRSRTATFLIKDDASSLWYWYAMGGLSLEGDVQALLDTNAAQLWTEAQANGRLATNAELSQIAWQNLPVYLATWTPAQAAQYIHDSVFSGLDAAGADAWIDANVTGTNLATALASVRAALKILAHAIITDRDVVDSNMAQGILLLRDILKLQ